MALRQMIQLLEYVFDRNPGFKPAADGLLELLLDVPPNDKHQHFETGAEGVVNRVINEGFAMWSDRVDLFETAIAAAHSCG